MEQPRSTGLQRVGPLATMPAVLDALGLDPGQVFADLSFDLSDLRQPDALIRFSDALTALDRTAQLSGHPEVGLLIGLRNDHRCFGLVGALMDSAPTLGVALSDYVSVQGSLSSGGSAYLIPMGDTVAFGFGVYDRFSPGFEQAYGIAAGVGVRVVRGLSGGAAEPVEVHLCGCRAECKFILKLVNV